MNGRALYVYGVVPASDAGTFEGLRGVDPREAVVLVADGDVAALVSGVPLDEFGEQAIAANLREPSWLAEKARAHDGVLAAAVGRTPILPFRFGTVYLDEEHVREMLREHAEFPDVLRGLQGKAELGVKAFSNPDVLRERISHRLGAKAETTSSGRAYMKRKQLERRVEEAAEQFSVECARDSHERLARAAVDARMNPPRRPDTQDGTETMILNGAYLVVLDQSDRFRAALVDIEATYREDGISYELTGPWPPYNFVDLEDHP